jgi:hypothetical protein
MNDQEQFSYLNEKIELDLVEIGAMHRAVATIDLTTLNPALRAEFEEARQLFSHSRAQIQANSAAFTPPFLSLGMCVDFRKQERRCYQAYKTKLFGALQAGGVFKKVKRARVDGKAKELLEAWAQENGSRHPDFAERCQLAGNTELSEVQVSNWFVNSRSRNKQPLSEQQPTKAAPRQPAELEMEKPAKRVCHFEEQEPSGVPMVGSQSSVLDE